MQHLMVYSSAKTASTADQAVTFVPDPAIPTDVSGNPVLPTPMKLLAGFACGTNIQACRINSPYFRRLFLPYMWPIISTDTIPNDPNIFDLRDHPMNLPALEGIEVDTSNGTGANRHTVGLMIADTQPQQVTGAEVYTVRCTAAITCVAYTFVSGNLTFGQTLPQGNYGITGFMCQSATGICARLILPGQAYRPGALAVTALTNRPPFTGRKAPLGLMGTFSSTALPQIEVFAVSTDSAQVVFLDLVKL